MGRLLGGVGQHGFQGGEHADAVVLAVSADKGGVEADEPGRTGGHGLQFGRIEVFLDNIVLLLQQFEDVGLDGLLVRRFILFGVLLPGHALARPGRFCLGFGFGRVVFFIQGPVAEDDVQFFRVKGFGKGLIRLPLGQVGQQIRNGEHRLVHVFAQGYLYARAVLAHHHAVQGQGPGEPLVFADAAVIMRFGLADAGLLLQGVLLQIQARRVGVGANQAQALA